MSILGKNENLPHAYVYSPLQVRICSREYNSVIRVIDLGLSKHWGGAGTKLVLKERGKDYDAQRFIGSKARYGLHIPLPFPAAISAVHDFRRVAVSGENLDFTDDNLVRIAEYYQSHEDANYQPRILRRLLCTL